MEDHGWYVVWAIDISGPTPLEAARKAREAQTREGTIAVVFEVSDRKRNVAFEVDLQAPEGCEVVSVAMPLFDPEYLKVALVDARNTLEALLGIKESMDGRIIEAVEDITQALERG